MRAVVQRVREARVLVDNEVAGQIAACTIGCSMPTRSQKGVRIITLHLLASAAMVGRVSARGLLAKDRPENEIPLWHLAQRELAKEFGRVVGHGMLL